MKFSKEFVHNLNDMRDNLPTTMNWLTWDDNCFIIFNCRPEYNINFKIWDVTKEFETNIIYNNLPTFFDVKRLDFMFAKRSFAINFRTGEIIDG